MTRYTLTLSKDYCLDWTVPNAIREICQNCLDSPSTFEYDIGNNFIELTSKSVQLSPKTLILGMSGKRSDPDSVGGFGEGYKVALVVLLRNNIKVIINNGNKKWIPSFEWNDQFQEEMLTIIEEEGCGSDLTFHISNVSSSDLKQVIEDCLYLQDDLGNVWEGTRGRIFDSVAGKLYVGGLYVTNIAGTKYSYDFKPQYLPLNRDRKTVENWEVNKNTSELCKEVFAISEIADMIEGKARDVENIQYRDNIEPIKEELFNRFITEFGNNAVICNSTYQQNEMRDKGFSNPVIVCNDSYYNMVSTSRKYSEHQYEIESELDEIDKRSPLEILRDWWVYQEADEFEPILDIFEKRGVSFDS